MSITLFRQQVASKDGNFVTSLGFFLSPFLCFSFIFISFSFWCFFAVFLRFCRVFVIFFFCMFCVFVVFMLFCPVLFIIFEIAFPISEIEPQNSHCIGRTDWCIASMVHFVG